MKWGLYNVFSRLVVATLLFVAAPAAFGIDLTTPLPLLKHDVWRDELPQQTVTSIVQTRDGYIWLGTFEGLVRFNGVEFTVFDSRNTREIRNSAVRTLYEDRAGRLWIGTLGGGLVWLDGGQFHTFPEDHPLARPFIHSIVEDRDGAIWAGSDGFVVRLAGDRIDTFSQAHGLPNSIVYTLTVDGEGTLWAGTFLGLGRFTGDGFEMFTEKDGLPHLLVTTLLAPRDGGLWIGFAGGGLARFDGLRFTSVDGLPGAVVWALYEDSNGTLWVGTYGGGLSRMRDGRFETFGPAQGLTQPLVRTICEDREGSLWIGTNGGLNRLKNEKFVNYSGRHGLSEDNTRVVCQDLAGDLWVGTDSRGLNRISGDKVTVFTKKDGLPSDLIRALTPSRDGGLWIGTNGEGIAKFKDGRFTVYRMAHGLASDRILSLCEDVDGQLWVGTAGSGASVLRDGRFTIWSTANGLPHNNVASIVRAREGGLWLGTHGGGLARYRDGAFETFTEKDGLAGDAVYAIYEDAGGTIWLGTSGGLGRLRDGAFATFRVEDGLVDNRVFQILEDDSGFLWLSSNLGVSRVSKRDLELRAEGRLERLPVSAFDKADGMGSTQCNGTTQPAGWRTLDGRLCFPTAGGLTVIDPGDIRYNAVPPGVTIVRALVDGQPIARVSLPSTSEKFEFQYDGLSFLVPGQVRFRYQLEGLDRAWIDAGTRRVAMYNSLPPGRYTFRVMACNDDGLWSEGVAAVVFDLPPPPWKTWWAYLAYASALALACYALVRLRLHSLHRKTRLLEARVGERTAELRLRAEQLKASEERAVANEERALELADEARAANRAKSVFLASMSHELRTPLNAILGFAQLLDRDRALGGGQRRHLGTIVRSGEHLLGLINDILSISKIEAGKTVMVEQAFDLPLLLRTVVEMIRVRTQEKGLRFAVEIEPGLPESVLGDEGKLRQVLINLLGNAVKFTASGTVTLSARWAEGRARFSVEDTGPGISSDELGKLFEPFVQTESGRKSQEGTGLGLAITRNIVHLMDGRIWVRSEPGVGTVFEFDVALPEAARPTADEPSRRVASLRGEQPVPRILVVDDVEENRRLLAGLLESVGIEARQASGGRQAVELAASWRPALVWMDLRMPGMDGLEATRAIREQDGGHGRTAERTTIIALSASALDHERDEALAGGCDDFVAKPFRAETIFDKLAEHLGLEFEYEADPAQDGADDAAVGTETPLGDRLREIPVEALAEVRQHLLAGDVRAARDWADRVEHADGKTVAAMRAMIVGYKVDALLDLVESALAGDARPKDTAALS